MSEMIGAVVQIILGYMQSQRECAACFHSQIPSLCFTIALIVPTAAWSPPSSRALQICNFHLILGSAVLLSSTVPSTLRWLPYLSCIRPLFHLLPLPFQLRITLFYRSIWVAIKCYVCSLFDMLSDRFQLQSFWNAMRQFATVDTSCPDGAQSSLPAEANFDLEVGNRDGSTWEAIKYYVCSLFDMLPDRFRLQSVWNAMRQFVTVDTSCPDGAQSSLPAEANFDLEVVIETVQTPKKI